METGVMADGPLQAKKRVGIFKWVYIGLAIILGFLLYFLVHSSSSSATVTPPPPTPGVVKYFVLSEYGSHCTHAVQVNVCGPKGIVVC